MKPMDSLPANQSVSFIRWLPYWAVLQADVQQTLRGWVYRIWVIVSILAATGYLLYRYGLTNEVGIVQPASKLVADILRWTLLGSVTLIVVLCAGSISGERGTMADSVLSRGISRHQYFLGKWHARLFSVLISFWIMAASTYLAGIFLLQEDITMEGCLVAVGTASAFLFAIISLGVTASAICNSTILGITILWVILYGGGFVLSLLPSNYPSPIRLLTNLPMVLKGYYDPQTMWRLVGWSFGVSFASVTIGLFHFARRDI